MAANAPEWRFGNGWTDEALSARLAALVAATEGASPGSSMSAWTDEALSSLDRAEPGRRMRHLTSREVLAQEGAGAPESGGPFARACGLVTRYELSDPSIVTAHFDHAAPLPGRPMLLEIKVLGLRYLCATVVGDVVGETSDYETRFGFRLDTLASHLERGSEWFMVTKDHRDGLVRFSIAARWEPGQFPNRWSRLGFALLARRYQRAWHRRAFRRLRERLGSPDIAADGNLARATGRAWSRSWSWTVSARTGAVAGLRSMMAPALVARALEHAGATGQGLAGRALASPAAGLILPVLAALELLADKLPTTPARVRPAPLIARAISGAFAASALAPEQESRRRSRIAPALVAAASAIGAAFAGYHLRRWVRHRSGLPDAIVAVVEDAAALTLGPRV
jgi:uncharacterized membrane protein/uncharacterized protein (UPF0548 family)